VFGAVNALTTAQQTLAWEAHKAAERREIDAVASHIDGVPLAMPALLRAANISKRAARVGFDWHAAEQTADKVAEELGEVREAMRARGEAQSAQKIAEEIGDLLFATANLARKLGLDPESALRAANAKFDKRFRAMERLAAERGQRFEELDLVAQESLWEAVKQAES
jgi:ATP diphosphatase